MPKHRGGNGAPPIPPGARILQPRPKVPQVSEHLTTLRASLLHLQAHLSDDDMVTGYRLSIIDQFERHTYVYDFGQEVRDAMLGFFAQCPEVGQKAEADA